MALNKAGLQAALVAVFSNSNNTAAQAAKQIADAVDAYVKTATVTTVVAGTSPAGPVTGSGTGTLS